MQAESRKGWPENLPAVLEYKNGMKPLHEYLRENARTNPEKVAIVWYGREITYFELDELSDRFAVFLTNLGIHKGDRVALMLQNCPQYHIAHFGMQKIGAIVGPCSPVFKEWELEYQLNNFDTETIVAADSLFGVIGKVLPQTGLKHIILTNYGDFLPASPALNVPEELKLTKTFVPGTYDLLTVIKDAQGTVPLVEVDMEDVALMVYTSGTTGRPKGAMLTYRNALSKAAAGAQSNQVLASDILLSVAPLYHIAGMLMGINIPIYSNATTLLLHRFEPEAILQAIDRYKCTWWYSIAPMNAAVMQVPNAPKYNLSSLKINLATSFGISVTEDLSKAWANFTGGCPLYEGAYGLSETHTCDTFMPSKGIKWGTQGIATYDTVIKIVDPESGAEKPVDEMGEIVVTNPGVFKGYWKNPEATAKTLRNGWVYTGDMGKLDEDGYLTFCGRLKEMIKVSGYSVFPEDVENMLIRHPSIAQAAVKGVPDSQKGEVVKAFVVLKPDQVGSLSPKDIIDWAQERMAHYKYPRQVEFREALPATGTGKVLRRLLKGEFLNE